MDTFLCTLGIIGVGVFFFALALGVVQMLGVDREPNKDKTGKLTRPTKRQLKLALAGTIGLAVVMAIVGFFLKDKGG